MRSLEWALIQYDLCLYKRFGHTQEQMGPREDSERRWPSTSQDKLQKKPTYQHLVLRLVASRIVKEYISIV